MGVGAGKILRTALFCLSNGKGTPTKERRTNKMALTRSFLASKGIEASVIEEIITKHTETVSGLKDDLDKANSYKDKADKLEAVEKELNDLKAEVAKNGGKSYEALKKEFDDYKAGIEKEKTHSAKEKVYREAMKDASLNEKGIEKAVKYADFDKIELDDEGKLKNAKDHIKAAKEEWAEYVVSSQKKGADTNTPPGNNGGKGKLTEEDIYKTDEHGRFLMDATARQAALAEIMHNEAE